MTVVPFLDLHAQIQPLKQELLQGLSGVLDSCQFANGNEVAAFEKEFSEFLGGGHVVALNTGTSALHLAMLALGIGPGDEIITVPMTFIATASAIHYTGARPVFVDVDEGTCTMDPARVEQAITPRTKAIVPVHLYGQCADMDPILEIAGRHGIPVIEDAAQAHGAIYHGKMAGTMGTLSGFSFYPGKNLGACGEGGAAWTRDENLAHIMRMLRDWGQSKKYHHDLMGFNYRMDGFQGACLRVKLRHLASWTTSRQQHAQRYDQFIKDVPAVRTPKRTLGPESHAYHIYALRCQRRDELKAHLESHGIQTALHYPVPVHLTGAFAHLGYQQGDFPKAEAIAATELSLPMFPELTESQIDLVVQAIRDFQ